MARLGTSRRSFNPEALSQIALIVDDVWKELAKESAYDASGAGLSWRAKSFSSRMRNGARSRSSSSCFGPCAIRCRCSGGKSVPLPRKCRLTAALSPQTRF